MGSSLETESQQKPAARLVQRRNTSVSAAARRASAAIVPAVPGRQPLPQLIEAILARIPSHFGKLLYLSRCCNDSGMYRHYGLELEHSSDEVHRMLRQAHLEEWTFWMSEFGLQDQFLDVLQFLYGVNARLVLQSWEPAGDHWGIVVPRAASLAERDLFNANFRSLITILKGHFPSRLA